MARLEVRSPWEQMGWRQRTKLLLRYWPRYWLRRCCLPGRRAELQGWLDMRLGRWLSPQKLAARQRGDDSTIMEAGLDLRSRWERMGWRQQTRQLVRHAPWFVARVCWTWLWWRLGGGGPMLPGEADRLQVWRRLYCIQRALLDGRLGRRHTTQQILADMQARAREAAEPARGRL